jgi:hypothetical protein
MLRDPDHPLSWYQALYDQHREEDMALLEYLELCRDRPEMYAPPRPRGAITRGLKAWVPFHLHLLQADLKAKERALQKLTPVEDQGAHFTAADPLLVFLTSL